MGCGYGGWKMLWFPKMAAIKTLLDDGGVDGNYELGWERRKKKKKEKDV